MESSKSEPVPVADWQRQARIPSFPQSQGLQEIDQRVSRPIAQDLCLWLVKLNQGLLFHCLIGFRRNGLF
jgi:hypothetical protein